MSVIPKTFEERYERQLCLPDFGLQQQLLLQNASVTIIGAGGLGCPVALYLAGAGVGKITVVDGDVIEISNLHRQIAHETQDIGLNKSQNLIQKLNDLNPEGYYQAIPRPFNTTEINLLETTDLIIDCSDNFGTHFLISDTCQQLKKPWVLGSVYQYQGQALSFLPTVSPCYRCLYSANNYPRGNCAESGILGPVTGVIGSIMAGEALAILLGKQPPSVLNLLYYDFPTQRIQPIQRVIDPECECLKTL